MATDLQKSLAGAVLFGASALTGNALLMAAAGGVGVNWASEGLGGLWRSGVQSKSGGPLADAGGRAIRRAVVDLRKRYREQYGKHVDTAAFDLVSDCADAVSTLDSVAPPAELVGAANTLAKALSDLLLGHEERQVDFLQKELLDRVAQTFHEELASDTAARREYREMLTASMLTEALALRPQLDRFDEVLALLNDDRRITQLLADSLDQLAAQIAALHAMVRLLASQGSDKAGDRYIESAIAEGGGLAAIETFTTDSSINLTNLPATGNTFVRSAVARGTGSRATAINRLGVPGATDPAPAAGRPPALVLTIQLSPTASGALVRWSADEIGVFHSTFTTPYRSADLAAVLRALENMQHPDFALASGDENRLAALGLLLHDGTLPEDLPCRVGRAIYNALTAGQGIAGLTIARSQAVASGRPLALRLLIPPDAIELAALPWELLWDNRPAPWLINVETSAMLTRHLDLPGALPTPLARNGRPLRIVALTPYIERTEGENATITRELRLLWDELRGQAVAEVVEISPATSDDLEQLMNQELKPDIVQFTGHGWYNEGRGVLFFDPAKAGATRSSDLIDAQKFATALRGVGMVIIASCRGAHVGVDAQSVGSLLSGIAPAISAAGVPLVVGMQMGIQVGAALRACNAIYRALAKGASAQAALSSARDGLYIIEQDNISWYVPTLYIRSREDGPAYI